MERSDPNDPVAVYLREVASIDPLSQGEETELFQLLGHSGTWDEKAETAARRLIESQLRLVVAIAERHSSSGMPMLDLIEHGNLGLMTAVKTFAEKDADDFSTYAAVCIEAAIVKAIAESKSRAAAEQTLDVPDGHSGDFAE
jgi:RNA polymerase primary sigma factor